MGKRAILNARSGAPTVKSKYNTIQKGEKCFLKVTNYNSANTYSVSVNAGSATIDRDIITYQAGAEQTVDVVINISDGFLSTDHRLTYEDHPQGEKVFTAYERYYKLPPNVTHFNTKLISGGFVNSGAVAVTNDLEYKNPLVIKAEGQGAAEPFYIFPEELGITGNLWAESATKFYHLTPYNELKKYNKLTGERKTLFTDKINKLQAGNDPITKVVALVDGILYFLVLPVQRNVYFFCKYDTTTDVFTSQEVTDAAGTSVTPQWLLANLSILQNKRTNLKAYCDNGKIHLLWLVEDQTDLISVKGSLSLDGKVEFDKTTESRATSSTKTNNNIFNEHTHGVSKLALVVHNKKWYLVGQDSYFDLNKDAKDRSEFEIQEMKTFKCVVVQGRVYRFDTTYRRASVQEVGWYKEAYGLNVGVLTGDRYFPHAVGNYVIISGFNHAGGKIFIECNPKDINYSILCSKYEKSNIGIASAATYGNRAISVQGAIGQAAGWVSQKEKTTKVIEGKSGGNYYKVQPDPFTDSYGHGSPNPTLNDKKAQACVIVTWGRSKQFDLTPEEQL